jgi:transaldolase
VSEARALRVKLFADGADVAEMQALAARPEIQGFTTNPTLMHKAGIRDYRRFAREVLAVVGTKPISFEVFADDFPEMERQAREIATWGPSVYVKIPITDTAGRPTADLTRRLSHDGVRINVTAVLTVRQVASSAAALSGGAPSLVSIFAGRIADTGLDPMPIVAESVQYLATAAPATEVIWASPRELLNIFQADAAGCHIITITADILKKWPMVGKDLAALSLETVRMFRDDAVKAGFHV